MGKLGEATIFASETVALDVVGARFLRDVEPGEMIFVNDSGVRSFRPFEKVAPRPCIFEHVYFSRPDSIAEGVSVYEVRKQIGAELAREAPVEADYVVPVPDSGVPAAIGFSQAAESRSSLGSSDRTMSGAPSSSRRRKSAISASSSSTMPIPRWSMARASS